MISRVSTYANILQDCDEYNSIDYMITYQLFMYICFFSQYTRFEFIMEDIL